MLVVASMASASVAPAQVLPVSAQASQIYPEAVLASNELPAATFVAPIAPAPDAPDAAQGGDDEQNADVAKSVPAESLGAMVARLRSSDAATRERACLATAIYFEAKSEPLAGQLAVGEVLANRVRSGSP